MKFVLASNILEHPAFPNFISAAIAAYPDINFLVAGDLLNIFPEPGENLEGSIFYQLYGNLIFEGMDNLVNSHFRDTHNSLFIEPLKNMFSLTGNRFYEAKHIAWQRYKTLFANLETSLENSDLYFIPGNMDYPSLSGNLTINSPRLHQIDNDFFEKDGIRIGGIGGVPNTVHPFKGVVEISPYEMAESEYEKRLNQLWGVDILITHVSPEEFPVLRNFLMGSPLKLLICRAPFNFRHKSDFRGKLEFQAIGDKYVIKVRPFDYPENKAYVIDIVPGITPLLVEVFSWRVSTGSGI
ncbi:MULTISPECIES: hypothetical protein [Cyanophyceae]|uniref:hypothetical protein n=1 Tax=Cyanophyceae TaxID=3028117 RepID=UPI0016858938|nr:hypothetical protein [Trichocoleus sp. FACHB-40]MBD2004138.1 hypothetical protein [Trichocoleus sp. FACHB-40]